MPRPYTLFTGQWADLPFEEVAKLASGWGYDGLEIAVSGDHLDAWRWDEPGYVESKLPSWTNTTSRSGPSPTTSRARPSAMTPSTSATKGSSGPRSGATGTPKASANAPPRK